MTVFVLLKRGYPSVFFRQIMAVMAAYLLVIFGEEISIKEVFLHPNFLPAMLGSYLIALILIEYTHWTTRLLDRWKARWLCPKYGFIARIVVQLIVGLLFSRWMAIRLATIYFRTGFDVDPADTSYPVYEIHFITALLFALNVLYLAFCCIKLLREPRYVEVLESRLPKAVLAFLPLGDDTAQAMKDSRFVSLPDRMWKKQQIWTEDTLLMGVCLRQIAYFMREKKAYFFYTFDGERLAWDRSLDRTMQHLSPQQYMRATKNFIINRKAYTGYEKVTYYCWKIQLNPPYRGGVKLSRVKTKEIQEWLEQ